MAEFRQGVAKNDTTPTIFDRLLEGWVLLGHAGNNVEDMADALSRLRASRNDFLDALSKSPRQRRPEQVENWFKRVEEVEAEVEKTQQDYSKRCLCAGSFSPNIFSNYGISRRAVQKQGKVKDLLKEYDTVKNLTGERPPGSCIPKQDMDKKSEVVVLHHDGRPVCESLIIQYIEEECPRLAAWAKQVHGSGERGNQKNRVVLPELATAPAMGLSEAEKPLRRLAASFEQLATVAKQSPGGAMDAGAFSRACSNVSVLFGCLGIAFKFAEMDYVSKVDDLLEASKSISTLRSVVELDIQKGTVRDLGSHTRNLLRVKRGIDMIKALFEQTLVTEGTSLRNAAPVAYAQVLAPHHGWVMRMAVAAAIYVLPSKSQMLKRLNEDEESAKIQMQNFVRSSAPVILYVEDIFTSRNLGIDW